jgi:hypothetical protein
MNKRLVVGVLLAFAIVIGSTAMVNAYDHSVCFHYVFVNIPGEGVVFCTEFCRYYDGDDNQIGWSCASTCDPCTS